MLETELGTLNDNQKIDYRNGFSFSCLLSILEMGTCALVAVSEERLLALLIIKLEPLTSVHTSRSAVLCCERWPGHRLACPVGLLGGRCDCRLSAVQDAMFSPPFPAAVKWRHYREADNAVMCTSFHTCCILHAALALPPPHSLRLNECSRDRSVSLVGWEREIGRRGCPSGAGVCRS